MFLESVSCMRLQRPRLFAVNFLSACSACILLVSLCCMLQCRSYLQFETEFTLLIMLIFVFLCLFSFSSMIARTQSTIAPYARRIATTTAHTQAHTRKQPTPATNTNTHAYYQVVICGDRDETPASLRLNTQEYVCVLCFALF